MSKSIVYLVPSLLSDDALESIPAYITSAVKDSQVIFAENERSARRFFKKIDKEIIIDDYEWHSIGKAEHELIEIFNQKIKEEKNIVIISEAGCPGIADPGQVLVKAAHELNVKIKPLVGPSSIVLALMASGMNGQQFQFVGYVPVENTARSKKIKELEEESARKKCTQIFIETPYRNDQLFETILKICRPSTRLCIAAELSGKDEFISTRSIADWKKEPVQLHKKPAIFLLQAN